MACDISLFAEVKKDNQWQSIDVWTLNEYYGYPDGNTSPEFVVLPKDRFYTSGRNYNLFCALCGVTAHRFSSARYISNPKGLPSDCDIRIQRLSDAYSDDIHSHSWNTLKELKEFDWSSYGNTCDDFRNEIISKMESFNVGDEDIRIVYFFD